MQVNRQRKIFKQYLNYLFKKYPFQPRKIHSHDHLRQFLHLRPKTALTSAVLRIRNTATMAVHKYFQVQMHVHICSVCNINVIVITLFEDNIKQVGMNTSFCWNFKSQSLILSLLCCILQENGYIFIHTPILSSNDCEGAGQLFTVKVLL